jgi:hypothetical protein
MAMQGVRLFHRDLLAARSEIETLQQYLAPRTRLDVITAPSQMWRTDAQPLAAVPRRAAVVVFCGNETEVFSVVLVVCVASRRAV